MVTERSTYMRPTADRQHRWGPAHTSSYLDRSDDTFQGETMPRCTGWCTSQVPDLAISKKQVCVSKRVHHLRPLLDFKHNCWQHSVPHRTTLWGGTVSFPTTTTTTTTALDTNLGGATRGGGLYWCHSGLDLRVLPSKLLSQHTRCWRCMPRRGSHVTLVRRNPPRASETPCTGPLIPATPSWLHHIADMVSIFSLRTHAWKPWKKWGWGGELDPQLIELDLSGGAATAKGGG